MNIKYDDYIEGLEGLADELAGVGDRSSADFLTDVIKLLEDTKNLNVVKPVVDEGDCLRCPNCFHIVYNKHGRCIECGQRIRA